MDDTGLRELEAARDHCMTEEEIEKVFKMWANEEALQPETFATKEELAAGVQVREQAEYFLTLLAEVRLRGIGL